MYLNLNDLLMWIALLAMVRLAFQKHHLWAPRILIAILLINLFGAFHSLFAYGFILYVQRSIWAAIIFPAMFLVGVNCVNSEEQGRHFYWAFYAGALVAACQHLYFVEFQLGAVGPFMGEIRTIAYILSGGIFLAVSAIFVDVPHSGQRRVTRLVWLGGLGFIGLSYLLTFTRTLYVGVAASILGVYLVSTWQSSRLRWRLAYVLGSLVLIIGCTVMIATVLFPKLDLEGMIEPRMEFLHDQENFAEAYSSRERGMQTEINLWQEGSLVWGVGTTLPPSIQDVFRLHGEDPAIGALGHVAFSFYLAHFGLVGLLVYEVFLPLMTIKTGKLLFLEHRREYIGALALTAVALAFYDMATIFSSNHYLFATGHVPGLIYGALWGLSRQESPVGSPVLQKPSPGTLRVGMETSKHA